MISGTTIDTTRLPALAEPTAALHEALAATQEALAEVRGSGPLGRPVGAVADSLHGTVADLTLLAGAAEVALPALPDALGEQEPKRYLICALNDAELFGSGGAPLFAVMVEAVRGSIIHPTLGAAGVEAVAAQPPDRVGARRRAAVAPGQQEVPVRQLQLPPRLHDGLRGHATGLGSPRLPGGGRRHHGGCQRPGEHPGLGRSGRRGRPRDSQRRDPDPEDPGRRVPGLRQRRRQG